MENSLKISEKVDISTIKKSDKRQNDNISQFFYSELLNAGLKINPESYKNLSADIDKINNILKSLIPFGNNFQQVNNKNELFTKNIDFKQSNKKFQFNDNLLSNLIDKMSISQNNIQKKEKINVNDANDDDAIISVISDIINNFIFSKQTDKTQNSEISNYEFIDVNDIEISDNLENLIQKTSNMQNLQNKITKLKNGESINIDLNDLKNSFDKNSISVIKVKVNDESPNKLNVINESKLNTKNSKNIKNINNSISDNKIAEIENINIKKVINKTESGNIFEISFKTGKDKNELSDNSIKMINELQKFDNVKIKINKSELDSKNQSLNVIINQKDISESNQQNKSGESKQTGINKDIIKQRNQANNSTDIKITTDISKQHKDNNKFSNSEPIISNKTLNTINSKADSKSINIDLNSIKTELNSDKKINDHSNNQFFQTINKNKNNNINIESNTNFKNNEIDNKNVISDKNISYVKVNTKNEIDNEVNTIFKKINLSKNDNEKFTEKQISKNSQVNHQQPKSDEIKQKEINNDIIQQRNEVNNSTVNKFSTDYYNNQNENSQQKEFFENFRNNFSTTEKTGEVSKSSSVKSENASKPLIFNQIRADEIYKTISKLSAKTGTDGTVNAKINLHPKSLGKVFVEIKVNENNVKINIKADNKETVKIIENQIGSLREGLRNQGLQTEQLNVKLNDYGNEQNEKYLAEDNRNDRQYQEDRRSFLNTFGEDEAQSANIETDESLNKEIYKQGSYIEKYI